MSIGDCKEPVVLIRVNPFNPRSSAFYFRSSALSSDAEVGLLLARDAGQDGFGKVFRRP